MTSISASVAGAQPDPITANNTATTEAVVAARAELALMITGPIAGTEGEPLAYTATVTNDGADAASNVVLDFEVASGLTIVTATPSQASCGIDEGTLVICTLGTLKRRQERDAHRRDERARSRELHSSGERGFDHARYDDGRQQRSDLDGRDRAERSDGSDLSADRPDGSAYGPDRSADRPGKSAYGPDRSATHGNGSAEQSAVEPAA